jgi:hypothetical protein
MGNDVTEEQAIWRDDAIMRSQSTPLVERRVRMILIELLGLHQRRDHQTGIFHILTGDAGESDGGLPTTRASPAPWSPWLTILTAF